MKKIFDMNNPVFRFMGQIFDIIHLNFVWMLMSLPVITMGAASVAMHHVNHRLVTGQEVSVTKSFFSYFLKHWKQATLLSASIDIPVLVLMCDIVYLSCKESLAEFFAVQLLIMLLGAMLFLALSIKAYVPILHVLFENTIRNYIKNSLLLALHNLPKTVCVILVNTLYCSLALWSIFRFPPMCLFFFLFGLALPSNLAIRMLLPTLSKYIPQNENYVENG